MSDVHFTSHFIAGSKAKKSKTVEKEHNVSKKGARKVHKFS